MRDFTIEKATEKDFPYILGMYKKAIEEQGEEYVESLIVSKVVTSYHLAPCFLIKFNGIIRGLAGLTVNTSPWSGNATLKDYIFFIEPDYRNIESLGGLVEACKDFSREVKIPLQVDFIVNNDEKTKIRLLKRFGFEVMSVVGEYNG